jgi:hypothetical protein
MFVAAAPQTDVPPSTRGDNRTYGESESGSTHFDDEVVTDPAEIDNDLLNLLLGVGG